MNALGATFPVSVRFLSDWHVGTGEGRVGVVDALVRRDRDGLPFVPAKTLLGVWRDACETVVATLDSQPSDPRPPDPPAAGQPGPWTAWVDWLFGSQPSEPTDVTAARQKAPAPAAVSLTPARMPSGLRAALRDKPDLIEATVLLRPGVALGNDTGTAAEDMLRLEERALRGTLLLATASVHVAGDELPAAAELLLRAGARFVEALGGKRNRGSGRLVLRLGEPTNVAGVGDPRRDPPPDERLNALLADEALLNAPGELPDLAHRRAPILVLERRGTRHHRWRLELEAVTPVVIVDRVVGNNIRTRREIPGTALLPAVLSHLADSGAVGLDDLRVGDAVPAAVAGDGSAVPALATPQTWQRDDKGQGDSVINAALQPPDPAARYKSSRGRVARLGADASGGSVTGIRWRVVDPGTAVSTQAVVNDRERRPTQDAGGGLFSYLGIEAGTVLVSDLVLPEGVQLALMPGRELRLGRSRKDDFGRVLVRSLAPAPAAAPRRVGIDGTLRVWLISDLLLRDERHAPDPSPQRLGEVLGHALGAPLTPVPYDEREPRLSPTLTQTVRREGFAPRWGRHRPSLVGLRAGSVITFGVPEGTVIDPDKVNEVEQDGLGDRTVEGYGRLLLDPPELLTREPTVENASGRDRRTSDHPVSGSVATSATPAGQAAAGEALDGVDPDAPHPVELAAWRREIRRRVAATTLDPAAGEDIPDLRRIGRAQRGILRAQADRLALPGGRALVQEWLESLRSSVTRRTAWDEDTRGRLERLLLGDGVWAALDIEEGAQGKLVLAPGRERLLRAALAGEAVAFLIDELARQAQADDETPGPAVDSAVAPGDDPVEDPEARR